MVPNGPFRFHLGGIVGGYRHHWDFGWVAFAGSSVSP